VSWFNSIVKAAKVAVNPVAQTKAVKAAGVTVGKAAASTTSKVGAAVAQNAKVMHLPSIAATINIKQAITNPKAYAASVADAYKKDVGFGVQVYSKFKAGDFKGLAAQAGGDVVKAFGGSDSLAAKASGLAGKGGEVYGAYKKGGLAGAVMDAGKQAGVLPPPVKPVVPPSTPNVVTKTDVAGTALLAAQAIAPVTPTPPALGYSLEQWAAIASHPATLGGLLPLPPAVAA